MMNLDQSQQRLSTEADICGVCAKIISSLKGLQEAHSASLGTFHEVMVSTKCILHPRMFRQYFKTNIDNIDIEEFEVSSPSTVGGDIYLKAKVTNDPYPLYALAIYPFKWDLAIDCIGPTKILDPDWIDKSIFRSWKEGCNRQNQAYCQVSPASRFLTRCRPEWLVDTRDMCLVSGDIDAPYIALSYVWGSRPFFKTLINILPGLLIKDALLGEQDTLEIPKTIQDAIAVVRLLNERYLWVDSLCIVQDHIEKMSWHINNMGKIFADASVTIVAAQGENAYAGLYGISKPRKINQEFFELEESLSVMQCQKLAYDYRIATKYAHRAWTFQEGLFSPRTLIFTNNTVRWRCGCSDVDEDCRTHYGVLNGLSYPHRQKFILCATYPDFRGYSGLVRDYNSRDITYPEDIMAAFAGTLTTLTRTFPEGFVCGLPVIFFDDALCWMPSAEITRRKPSTGLSPTEAGLPSWSWVGWKFRMHALSWTLGEDYLKNSTLNFNPFMLRTIPTVKWSIRKWGSSSSILLQSTSLIHEYRSRYFDEKDEQLPTGWKRLIYKGSSQANIMMNNNSSSLKDLAPDYFYKHDSDPVAEFWYPVPLCNGSAWPNRTLETLISCSTQRTTLYISERMSMDRAVFSIRDCEGRWVGALHRNDGCPAYQPQLDGSKSFDQTCELVSISRGFVHESKKIFYMDEWEHEERPKELEKYEFHNVLWIEWENGIAYRKGLGRIVRSAWEAQELESIDLILG